jgi:uncharacterized protein
VIRATVDANILVSAVVYRRGKSFQLLQKGLGGEINLAVSQSILDEDMEVLQRKFGAPPDFIEEARQECAVTAGSEFIITGDKDLLRLGSYDSIRIVTVADFLAQAQSRQS